MSISISGSTALSGLSGMDTNFDTTLEQLYSVEKTQLNQLEAWRSDWQLRYDAFNDVIDQMSAAKEMLATIGSVNNFVTKNAVSTDDKVLTAVASGTASDSHHSITVSQMASNSIWCNTAIFESKTDIINDTGQPVDFTFEYAGKSYTYKIAPNTTLESFVSLINNASNNPGITMSVINTGKGYVYQIAGKSTGDPNSLTIYGCDLKGMSAAGTESVWTSNTSYDLTEPISNPGLYTYTATLESGTKVSVSLKGDATIDEVGTALQNAASSGLITKSVSGSTLTLQGVTALTRTKEGEETQDSNYTLQLGSNLSDTLLGSDSTEKLTVTVELDEQVDGQNLTREFTIAGSSTKQQFIDQINQALGTNATIGMDAQGIKSLALAGVKNLSFTSDATDAGGSPLTYAVTDLFTGGSYTAGTGNSFAATMSDATLTLTVADPSKRLDAATADGGSVETLRYTLLDREGKATYIDIGSDQTYADLLSAIKSELSLGDDVSGTDGDGNTTLTLAGYKAFYCSVGKSGTDGIQSSVQGAVSCEAVYPTGTGASDYYFEEPPALSYSIVTNDGQTITLGDDELLPSGSTMLDIYRSMRDKLAAASTTASIELVDSNGDVVTFDANDNPSTTDGITIRFQNVQSVTSPILDGQIVSSSNWSITKACNAIYEVDNWPMSMQSESNTITDLLDGVALTLQGVGQANLTISTDIASIETSIQNFLDSVNSVLVTIRDLTKVDENKQTTTNDPDSANASNYSKSTLTAEKGGLLTGNYGVQLVKTRFLSVVTGTPPGFQSISSADDLLSGDILSCLSNLGVKTDTDTTSSTYGLLVRAPRSDFMQSIDEANYNDMINNHTSELVDFFVSSGTGASTSSDFRYSSHISGITEAGIYDVNYDVEDGVIKNVTIGGEACTRNESQGGYYYTCTSGAARGLAISIDDVTEGAHTGQVRIKQGLVQTVQYFLEKELKFNDVNVSSRANKDVLDAQISLKSQNGAMMTLRSNYAQIMENIDSSIEKEQKRLSTWYTRQKNVFANLETLLRELNDKQTSLESQLKQLGGD